MTTTKNHSSQSDETYPECKFCHFRGWDHASLSRHMAVTHAIILNQQSNA